MNLDCPVCARRCPDASQCPQCGTDLSLIQLLRNLPEAPRSAAPDGQSGPPNNRRRGLGAAGWPLWIGLALVVGTGTGFAASGLRSPGGMASPEATRAAAFSAAQGRTTTASSARQATAPSPEDATASARQALATAPARPGQGVIVAPAGRTAGFRYRIRPGDYPWKIAAMLYGDGRLWTHIVDHEGKPLGGRHLRAAEILIVPNLEEEAHETR